MPKRELSLKQRIFIKEYIKNGGNATEAAEKAGFNCTSRNSFCTIGLRVLGKVQNRIQSIMKARGIDNFRLTEVLEKGLSSEKTVSVFNTDDKANVSVTIPDHPTRHKYLETALKINGDFAPEKREITGKDSGPIEIKPKGTIFDRLEKYAKLFEPNSSGEEGPALGNGPGKLLDTAPANDKTG